MLKQKIKEKKLVKFILNDEEIWGVVTQLSINNDYIVVEYGNIKKERLVLSVNEIKEIKSGNLKKT